MVKCWVGSACRSGFDVTLLLAGASAVFAGDELAALRQGVQLEALAVAAVAGFSRSVGGRSGRWRKVAGR